MHIVVLSGSPRKKGNTAIMVDAFKEGTERPATPWRLSTLPRRRSHRAARASIASRMAAIALSTTK